MFSRKACILDYSLTEKKKKKRKTKSNKKKKRKNFDRNKSIKTEFTMEKCMKS